MPVGTFVNPEIIMGYKSPDFSGLDPTRMMSNVLAYKQAQTQQQTNALALQEAKQKSADQALLQEAANQSDPVNYLLGLGRVDIANTYAGLQRKEQGEKLELQTKEQTLEDAKRKAANEQFLALAPQRYAELQNVSTPEDYMKWHLANPELYGTDKAARTAQIQEALAQEGGLDRLKSESKSALETILGIKPAEPKYYQPTAFEAEFALYQQDPAAYRKFKEAQKVETGAATTEKPLTATQKAALKKSQVEDQTNISTLKSTADDLERLTDDLVGNATKGIAPDPGLKGITGAQAYLPSAPKVTVGGVEITSGKARIAQQKLDTIKGKVMALGRQLATEHGKLGNMAVQEWKFISDAVQKIDPAADNFEDQLRDIVRQARDLESRARSRYEMQYEESSAPAADGKVQLSPQDQAALDWANKNPKDPRAAQIKAKLGVK